MASRAGSRRGRPRPVSRLALAACAACLLIALPAAARELVIRHFDARILVNANGSIDVTETITAHFIGSNWHGLYRTIPVEYTTPEGLNYTLFLTPVSVTDDAGNPLRYERSRQGRYTKFKIYVPNPDNSTRVIALHYRVRNGLRFFNDHDELYWNVTGNEWDVPIDSVTAGVELPAGVTGLHAIAYTGAYGSRAQDAEIKTAANLITYRPTRPLGFHEGLTVVVGWDKGFVRQPGAGQKAWLFLLSNWPFGMPIAAFFLMFWLWWTRGRDPERDAITVQYEPPDKLTPSECGTLVDDNVSMRDITATLVDLAVKGYLTIEQSDTHSHLGLHHRDYIFHLEKPQSEWSGLRPYESVMLNGIFFSPDPALPIAAALSSLQSATGNTAVGAIASRVLSAMARANPTMISDFSGDAETAAATPAARSRSGTSRSSTWPMVMASPTEVWNPPPEAASLAPWLAAATTLDSSSAMGTTTSSPSPTDGSPPCSPPAGSTSPASRRFIPPWRLRCCAGSWPAVSARCVGSIAPI